MTGTILLNGLWQGALVAAIAWIAAWCLPKHHAASRYAVWFCALLALVGVPVITAWHPSSPIAAVLPAAVTQTAAVTTAVTARALDFGGLWLAILWVCGVGFCFVRLGLSYVRLARIVESARPAPDLGENVLVSGDVAVPIAAGLRRPVVVIPAAAARDLDAGDLAAIVAHERAHIARGDLITNAMQRIVECVLFFNPWAYVIGRQLVLQREAACDDWAVHETGTPDRYALCLAQLAIGARRSGGPLLAPSALGSKPILVGRIARLLDGKAITLKTNLLAPAASVVAFAVLAIALQSKGVASVQSFVATSTNVASEAACSRDVTIVDAAFPNIPHGSPMGTGVANASVTVGPDGKPFGAKIVLSSHSAAVDKATVAAAMASTYSPKMSNCKAVVGTYVFHVEAQPQ